MSKIKEISHNGKHIQWQFLCPGCKTEHAFEENHTFNGDLEKPCIYPSVIVNYSGVRCHSLIEYGKISFFNDCDHELKGKVFVPLPDFDERQEVRKILENLN